LAAVVIGDAFFKPRAVSGVVASLETDTKGAVIAGATGCACGPVVHDTVAVVVNTVTDLRARRLIGGTVAIVVESVSADLSRGRYFTHTCRRHSGDAASCGAYLADGGTAESYRGRVDAETVVKPWNEAVAVVIDVVTIGGDVGREDHKIG